MQTEPKTYKRMSKGFKGIGMNLVNLTKDYADALKEAIIMRRAGSITPDIDNQLGHICHSITQWCIGTRVLRGQLYRTHASDEDFQSDILLKVVEGLDKVNVDRKPKEIIVYLYRIAYTAINDKLDKLNAKKRVHEEWSLLDSDIYTDFYGENIEGFEHKKEVN